ncbi:hypothetical protein LXL04_037612 [Taraxacum kok-saghyz]
MANEPEERDMMYNFVYFEADKERSGDVTTLKPGKTDSSRGGLTNSVDLMSYDKLTRPTSWRF